MVIKKHASDINRIGMETDHIKEETSGQK